MEIPKDYRCYPLLEPLIVNDCEFKEIIIDPHYEEKHGSYLTDRDILKIVQQLNLKIFPFNYGRVIEETNIKWQNFFYEPFFYKEKPYRLIWYWEIGNPQLLVLNCHRVNFKKEYKKLYEEWYGK